MTLWMLIPMKSAFNFFSILYSMKFTIDVKVDWQTKINQKFADDQINTFNSLNTSIREVFLKLHFYKKQ